MSAHFESGASASVKRFPWRIFKRLVFLQGSAVVFALLVSALITRLFFKVDVALLVFSGVFILVMGAILVWSARDLVIPLGRLLVKAREVAVRPRARAITEEDLDAESYGEWSELESSIEKIRRDLESKTESLNREREELAILMSAISDAILAVDHDGIPMFFNSRFELIFGDRILQKKNLRLWEIFRDPDILHSFESALKEGKTSTSKTVPMQVAGQQKRFFSFSVAPLRRRDGTSYGAVSIFHDVTDLKAAEQIRIDFVANVSHELRTPLTAIKGYTDTVVADLKQGRSVDPTFVDTISRNADRLMSLITDLLDLSTIESLDVLTRTRVPTREVTARVLGQLQHGFDEKKQHVDLDVQAATVNADPKRLEQVLVNLLDNARKYTPEGGDISVKWKNQGSDVILEVSDSGPGIPHEHHARLFERFYRVDKARSREMGGTGLGLAIVKHIMQRHQGSVWVESEPERGTTFSCRFPQ